MTIKKKAYNHPVLVYVSHDFEQTKLSICKYPSNLLQLDKIFPWVTMEEEKQRRGDVKLVIDYAKEKHGKQDLHVIVMYVCVCACIYIYIYEREKERPSLS